MVITILRSPIGGGVISVVFLRHSVEIWSQTAQLRWTQNCLYWMTFLELANDISVHRGVRNFDDELNYTKASFVHSSLFTCNTAVRYSQCMIFWFTVLLFNCCLSGKYNRCRPDNVWSFSRLLCTRAATIYRWFTVVSGHAPSCDIFNLGFIIFQCRTNDRVSYVLSYGQPLA